MHASIYMILVVKLTFPLYPKTGAWHFLLDIEVLDIDSWVLVLVKIDGCAVK
jgi:hypothetical protein